MASSTPHFRHLSACSFNKDFTFSGKPRICSITFFDLGMTHVYASPIFSQPSLAALTATMSLIPLGSIPKIGSEADFALFQEGLRKAWHGPWFSMWYRIICRRAARMFGGWTSWENGPASAYASYFDIDWHPPSRKPGRQKFCFPFLGKPFGEVPGRTRTQGPSSSRGRLFRAILRIAFSTCAEILRRA